MTGGVRLIGRDGSVTDAETAIATEIPVDIVYGNIAFAVMMMTPDALTDFAYGFSLTEGLIDGADDIVAVEVSETGSARRITLQLKADKMQRHLARKRAMSGRTSCGLCGIEDAASLALPVRTAAAAAPVRRAALFRALDQLEAAQSLNALTRATHGAAWFDRDGALEWLREDVGRHNALDKLIGALLRAGIGPDSGFLCITSRASFEMIDKASRFGASTVVAVSAPTALALERAKTGGMTLIGVARRDGVRLYCGEMEG